MEAKTAEGERKMKKLLAVCLTALVCWVCAGYAEETRVGDTVMFGNMNRMAILITAVNLLRGRCWMCRAAKRC